MKEFEIKPASEMIQKGEERAKKRMGKRYPSTPKTRQNLFPFSPAREGRPNPLGLNLNKYDCRILRAVQEHGFLPVREFCRLARVKESVFYQRFRDNPHLGEALKLLAFSSLALSFPKAMETLSTNFEKNPKWAELWLKVVGLINEPAMKLVGKPEQSDSKDMIERRISEFLLESKGGGNE